MHLYFSKLFNKYYKYTILVNVFLKTIKNKILVCCLRGWFCVQTSSWVSPLGKAISGDETHVK